MTQLSVSFSQSLQKSPTRELLNSHIEEEIFITTHIDMNKVQSLLQMNSTTIPQKTQTAKSQ
jgi:hypothetical protein